MFIMSHLFILLIFLHISWINSEPLVQISQGILNGTIRETRNGRSYSSFLGIPYGKSPTGSLRFSNPVPAESWEGVRSANEDTIECLQLSISGVLLGNEDCLYLNVYSPRLDFNSSSSNELLPVMVWIHGGGFIRGNGSSANAGGAYFLDKDVVLVSLNYRLGIFGFFSTGDSAVPGNFGLKDQVLALKWIQKNIKAFGGDPKQVTIFGESAGGVSISLHAISNATNGLFHQYIIQSGSSLCPWAYRERSKFISFAKELAALVFCPFINSERLVACLRNRSVAKLMETSRIFSAISRFAQMTWTPTDEPEADGAFLTDSPENLINQNQMKDLPFITGQTSGEGLIITKYMYSSFALYALTRLNHNPLAAYISNSYLNSNHEVGFTSAINDYYFNSSLLTLSRSQYLDALTKCISDGFFLYPEVRLLEKVAPNIKNSIYFYSFGYRGTFSRTSIATKDNRNLGVEHGDELTYLFPAISAKFGLTNLTYSASDEFVIDLMIDLWTSFAIKGKPTSEKMDESWTPYNTKNKTFLQIGNIGNNTDLTVTLSNSYYTDRINFWKNNTYLTKS